MKSTKSKTPARKSRRVDPMTIASLIDSPSELTDGLGHKTAIVLMTRVRLARNLAGQAFPGWAKAAQREEIVARCRDALLGLSPLKRSLSLKVDELSDLEKQILVERHLISRELSGAKAGAGTGTNPQAATSYITVTVAPGETVWSLASHLSGGSDVRSLVSEIITVNSLTSVDLAAGQKLRIPLK